MNTSFDLLPSRDVKLLKLSIDQRTFNAISQ